MIPTEKQMHALMHLILESKDCGEETKRALWALLIGSENFTKPVYFTGYSEDIAYGTHEMFSSKGTTHLHELMLCVAAPYKLEHHGGYMKNGKFIPGLEDGKEHTHTIFLGPTDKWIDGDFTEISAEVADKIELKSPLYPKMYQAQ